MLENAASSAILDSLVVIGILSFNYFSIKGRLICSFLLLTWLCSLESSGLSRGQLMTSLIYIGGIPCNRKLSTFFVTFFFYVFYKSPACIANSVNVLRDLSFGSAFDVFFLITLSTNFLFPVVMFRALLGTLSSIRLAGICSTFRCLFLALTGDTVESEAETSWNIGKDVFDEDFLIPVDDCSGWSKL